jgi:hypothetical protein
MNLNKMLAKVFGSSNEREVKRLRPLVERVNALEDQVKKLSDEELRRTTPDFREKLYQILGEDPARMTREQAKKGGPLDEALNELMPEVFARVRETSRRVVGMRHFDVQIIGGSVLHSGKIAEMRTGEGKTLVATLPATLNAIAGRGVHVVTVNDYLARRDAEWMGRIYKALGLTVGVIQHDMSDAERQQAYGSDITYGTNNEFGFDYLRDNMKFDVHTLVQRALPGERVEIHRERGDQRLAFAGSHLGDLAVVQHHRPDQLHVEMAHAERALGALAAHRERLRQQILEHLRQLLAGSDCRRDALAELDRLGAQVVIRQTLERRLQCIDRCNDFPVLLQQALVATAEHAGQDFLEHGCIKPNVVGRRGDRRGSRGANRRRARGPWPLCKPNRKWYHATFPGLCADAAAGAVAGVDLSPPWVNLSPAVDGASATPCPRCRS